MPDLTKQLKKLPDNPGVYLFYNAKGDLMYVGKATSMKLRVNSYFRNFQIPISKSQPQRPIEEMIHEIAKIKWVETDSVLEAVILEGEYIKKFRPKYNIRWRDDKSWNYIVITKDKYPQIKTIREHDLHPVILSEAKQSHGRQKNDGIASSPAAPRNDNYRYIFGPFPGLNTKATLKILHRIFKYSTCRPVDKQSKQIRQSKANGKPCFYRQMGQCLGVCTDEITPKEYRAKVIQPLALFLRGGKKRLIKNLEKEMAVVSRKENYEEAGRLRDQIRSLKHIHDVALLNESFVRDEISFGRQTPPNLPLERGGGQPFPLSKGEGKGVAEALRIEGYDISNFGATGKVGSLVVFDESGPRKNEYKKFNIKGVVGQSDVDCLAEVLERRFNHPEWPYPDVVLVDGGKPQVSTVLKIISHHPLTPSSIRRGIRVVGIAKGPDRKKNEIILGTKTAAFADWVYKHLKLLIQVRDEAHRFAIAFQRSKRKF